MSLNEPQPPAEVEALLAELSGRWGQPAAAVRARLSRFSDGWALRTPEGDPYLLLEPAGPAALEARLRASPTARTGLAGSGSGSVALRLGPGGRADQLAGPAPHRADPLRPPPGDAEGLLDLLHQRLRDLDGLDATEALDALSGLLALPRAPLDPPPVCAEERAARLRRALGGSTSGSREVGRSGPGPGTVGTALQLSDAALSAAGEALEAWGDAPPDLPARAFGRLLARAARAGLGQFFTPPEVAALLAEAVAPGPGERVIDPFAGAGGLLFAAARAGERWGIEKSERLVRIARADAALRGLPLHLLGADALLPLANFAALRPGSFDAALANPPFGASLTREALAGLGPFALAAGRRSAPLEALALERCLELLRPGGRLGVVLPDGVLTNPTHAATRRFLAGRARLAAVVSLPADAFEPYGARIKTSALFLRRLGERERPDPEAPVLLGRLGEPGLVEALREALAGRAAGPRQAELWARDRWRAEDRPAPAPAGPAGPTRRLAELVEERREAAHPLEHPERLFNRLGLEQVEARTGRLVGFAPVAGRELRSRLRAFRPGDVLFGRLRPEQGKVYAAVGEVSEGVCTPEFVVLTPRPGLLGPRLLRALLASAPVREAVRGLAGGSTLPRLALDDLLALELPVPPPERAAELEAWLAAEDERLRRLAAEVEAFPDRLEAELGERLGGPPKG